MAVSEASILEFIDDICDSIKPDHMETQFYIDFLKNTENQSWGYNALYRSAKASLELTHFLTDLGSDMDAWSEYRSHLRTMIIERWESYTENANEYQEAINNSRYPVHSQGA